MRIILVRHCTTSWNRQGKLQGHTDIPLDEGGVEEAKALGRQLAPLGIERIISSHLTRAVQTAELIGLALGLSVSIDRRICECGFGSIEGMTEEEAFRRYGEKIFPSASSKLTPYDFSKYGGETQAQVERRHLQVTNELLMTTRETTLLVGHGRGMNTLLAALDQEVNFKRNEWRIIEW